MQFTRIFECHSSAHILSDFVPVKIERPLPSKSCKHLLVAKWVWRYFSSNVRKSFIWDRSLWETGPEIDFIPNPLHCCQDSSISVLGSFLVYTVRVSQYSRQLNWGKMTWNRRRWLQELSFIHLQDLLCTLHLHILQKQHLLKSEEPLSGFIPRCSSPSFLYL